MSHTPEHNLASPSLHVPKERIVSIEHPCIVKNFDNAFKSLGGEQQLKHVVEHEVGETERSNKKGASAEPVAGVSLRPHDPFAKKLPSTGVPTQNVLIKVTVPKRTGRKRKRGSNEPYTASSPSDPEPTSITAPDMLQRMRDNPDRVTVEAVGEISDTHRFRQLPDFQVRAGDVPIIRELRDHAMVPEYDKLKALNVNVHSNSPLPGPPSFIPSGQVRRREPARQEVSNSDERIVEMANHPHPPKLKDLAIPPDAIEVPQGPPESLERPLEGQLAKAIDALEGVLEERPLLTRRVALSKLKSYGESYIRRAVAYLGYYFEQGPWRNTIVKYGVDPRADPKYRIYQTILLSFQVTKAIKEGPGYKTAEHGYVFDGLEATDPSNMWQLCDLTDPTLHHIVHTDDIRSHYDSKWGWYHNGTIAKICVIMRDKMLQLANKSASVREEDYMVLANLKSDVGEAGDCYLDESRHGRHLSRLAVAIGEEAVFATVMRYRGYDEISRVSARAGCGNGVGPMEVDGGQGGHEKIDDGQAENKAIEGEQGEDERIDGEQGEDGRTEGARGEDGRTDGTEGEDGRIDEQVNEQVEAAD